MNNAHDDFLRQSYLDNWNDYQYLLGRTKAIRWNWFIVTASNQEQARSYEMQIEYRLKHGWLPRGTRYAVIPDPDGKRVGSGGATLNVLRYIREHTTEADPFTGQRILVLHSGGDSKRAPQYSACGKLFSRVPRQLPDGRSSTLFDEFVIALSGVPSRMTDGVLVLSGDVLLLFNPLQIDLQRVGSACITIKAPVEVGSHHGVFLPDATGRVRQFLHKQTPDQLRSAGAVNEQGNVDIDTGAIWLGSAVVKNLCSLFEDEGIRQFVDNGHQEEIMQGEGKNLPMGGRPAVSEEKFHRFVNDTLRLSFYGDFVYPMVTGATLDAYLKEPAEGAFSAELEACRRELWPILHTNPMHLVRLSPARFIHFGTTRELHGLMLSASEQYAYLGWQTNVMSTGNVKAACINSVVEDGAQVSENAYLEDCHLLSGAVVPSGCIVSNATFSGELMPDTVLHGLPVMSGNSEEKTGWVMRIFGLGDNPKEGLDGNGTFLGRVLRGFLAHNGLEVTDVWSGPDHSLWTARLYPFCDCEAEALEWARVLQRMAAGEMSEQARERASADEVSQWKVSRRLSLQESFEAADMTRLMHGQEELEDTVRTLRFREDICSLRLPVHEAAAVLGTRSSLERRLLQLVDQANGAEFSSRIRILRAVSQLSRDFPDPEVMVTGSTESQRLFPELYEDLCWQTLNEAILNAVQEDLVATGDVELYGGNDAGTGSHFADGDVETLGGSDAGTGSCFADGDVETLGGSDAGTGSYFADGDVETLGGSDAGTGSHFAGTVHKLKNVDVALPVRVNWGGGWTDTPPYCLEKGGTVLNASISLKGELPVKAHVRMIDDPLIRLESRDLGISQDIRNLSDLVRCNNPSDPLSLHKAALRVCGLLPEWVETLLVEAGLGELRKMPALADILRPYGGGFALITDVDVPKGSGLGTSSILAGAVVQALTEAMGRPVVPARLFDQVLCMEQRMTTGGGWQDQVGGLVPGIKLISSRPGLHQTLRVEQLQLTEETWKELEERFVLIFTGQRRLARNLLREVVGKYMLNNRDSLEILDRMQEVAALMRFELERGNIDRFAMLLNEHWSLSCRLDAGSSNTCINQIIEVCRPLVDAVFIAGAGGGGFMQMILSRGITREMLKDRLKEVFQDISIEVWEAGFVR